MHCRYCSNWNFYDAKFCAYCGRELAAQDFLLTKFIITYYALFVVLGVFAALAIYWIQISKQIISLNNALIIDQNYPIYQSAFGKLSIFDLGIAGCLLLVGLIGLAIVWKLLGEFEEDTWQFNIGNIIRFAFLIPFFALMFSLTIFLMKSFYAPINLIAIMFLVIIGIICSIGIISFSRNRIKKWFIHYIVLFLLFFFILYLNGFAVISNYFHVSAFSSGVSAILLLYLIFAPLELLIPKIRNYLSKNE